MKSIIFRMAIVLGFLATLALIGVACYVPGYQNLLGDAALVGVCSFIGLCAYVLSHPAVFAKVQAAVAVVPVTDDRDID